MSHHFWSHPPRPDFPAHATAEVLYRAFGTEPFTGTMDLASKQGESGHLAMGIDGLIVSTESGKFGYES